MAQTLKEPQRAAANELSFDQRACFIAGQAKSGTTLLVALLDNHPELLVLPEETAYFPTGKFYRLFEQLAFDPSNADKDLLVLMLQAYATTIGQSFETVKRWLEKTPANRNHLPAIFSRFPTAKVLLMIRDPRA